MKTNAATRSHILTTVTLLIGLVTLGSGDLLAQTAGQTTFSSSKAAIESFIRAARAGDASGLQSILGAGSESVISSGDAVADKAARNDFLAKYDAKHLLVASGKNQFTLNVGSDDWPLPIPLIDNKGRWYFDGSAGAEEIVYRRIGHNELSAIDVCEGVVLAQHDYAASAHDGQPVGAYAEKIVSDHGKQNGLYWEVKPGEPASPAGPMLAAASQQGYNTSGQHTPYHGYYYRMLKKPEGFAFLAYPAEYRNSGIMTFVVTQDSVIYQKDLGSNTSEIASRINQYKLDDTWQQVK